MANCLLCNSNKIDDACLGEFLVKGDCAVHEFCLYLSSGLVQNGRLSQGVFGFLPNDIKKESQRAKKLICCYCNKRYANIGCCQVKCRRTFHLICGLKHGVENQFNGTFQSYCEKHVKKDRGPRKPPSHDELCCICYDPILVPGRRNPYTTRIQAPCCKSGWFHRNCLQGYARSAGYFFRCPLCNDSEKFLRRITYLGIFLRFSDASWELEPNAYEELLQRSNKCEADNCINPNGRTTVNNKGNPFVYCVTCGSVAFHTKCLPKGKQNVDCKECKQIVEMIPSTSKTDSGSEIIDVEDEEDEEVDICDDDDDDDNDNDDDDDDDNDNDDDGNDDDDDDDDDKKVDSTFRKNTPNVELVEDSSDEDNSSGSSSQQSNETAQFRKLETKRKIPIEFEDESNDDDAQIIPNNSPAQTDYDNDIDPIDFLGQLLDKRRRIDVANIAAINIRQEQETANKIPINDCNNVLQSKDENIPQTENNKKNALDISCIANRTRHRCILRPSLQQQQQQRTTFDQSPITSSRRTIRTDENKKTQSSNIGDISCVGHRTRRRVSLKYSQNRLSSIGEVSDSESNDSYKTPVNNKNYYNNNKRCNGENSAKSLASSSSTASSSSSGSSSSQLKSGRGKNLHKRLRIISSSDEEFD